jgi:hypothetical protein
MTLLKPRVIVAGSYYSSHKRVTLDPVLKRKALTLLHKTELCVNYLLYVLYSIFMFNLCHKWRISGQMSNLDMTFLSNMSSGNHLENLPGFSGWAWVQIVTWYSWHLAKEVINRSLVRNIGPLYQLWVHTYVSATGLSAQAHQCRAVCRASTQLGFSSWNLQFREIGLCLYINWHCCDNTVLWVYSVFNSKCIKYLVAPTHKMSCCDLLTRFWILHLVQVCTSRGWAKAC